MVRRGKMRELKRDDRELTHRTAPATSFKASTKAGSRRPQKWLQTAIACFATAVVLVIVFWFSLAEPIPAGPDRKQANVPTDVTVGRVVIEAGTRCRTLEFDNTTGRLRETGFEQCPAASNNNDYRVPGSRNRCRPALLFEQQINRLRSGCPENLRMELGKNAKSLGRLVRTDRGSLDPKVTKPENAISIPWPGCQKLNEGFR